MITMDRSQKGSTVAVFHIQKVHNKFGPLEDSAGKSISEGILGLVTDNTWSRATCSFTANLISH